MKRVIPYIIAALMVFSLFSLPTYAAEENVLEPVTLADTELVRIVLTDASNDLQGGNASFALEITNKSDIGLAFSLNAISVNSRLCSPSWVNVDDPNYYGDGDDINIPTGESRTVTAGWDMPTLAQAGVNYVQTVEGFIVSEWGLDYYMERSDEVGYEDMDAYMALESEYRSSEQRTPISVTFPVVDTDKSAVEDVVYNTDFEPVTIIDDEGVTAIVHDFYFDHDPVYPGSDTEIGPCLVISIENRTGELLSTVIYATIDGVSGMLNGGDIPAGKTLIKAMNFSGYEKPTSANNIQLDFSLYGTEHYVYGNYSTSLNLDMTPYAEHTSGVYGTAAWVENGSLAETEAAETESLTTFEYDSEGALGEPATLLDNDKINMVLTDVQNVSAEMEDATVTVEVTNKTSSEMIFGTDLASVNNMMCRPFWDSSEVDYLSQELNVAGGETTQVHLKWLGSDLSKNGINYVDLAEGFITVYQTDSDELRIPFSIQFPVEETDLPSNTDVAYFTEFTPVVIVDDEDVTAIVHDYYFGRFGPTLVVSLENRTENMLYCSWLPCHVNDTEISSSTGGGLIDPLPAGKSGIDEISFGDFNESDKQSIQSIDFTFSLLFENGEPVLQVPVSIDTSAYQNSLSGGYGIAKEPTSSNDLFWVPDPVIDAACMTSVGDNGEFRFAVNYGENQLGETVFNIYFENNGSVPVSFVVPEITIDGNSVASTCATLGDFEFQPGGAGNFYVELESYVPNPSFNATFNLQVMNVNFEPIYRTTVSASFSESGEAVIA